MEKAQLRKAMIRARQALSPDLRSELSRRAQEALTGTRWFRSAKTLLLYLPIRGEVETEGIARTARSAGKGLVLPRVQQEPRKLWLHAWVGEPVPGAYGIREPAAGWPLVEPGAIDLVVVPGVAFDRSGGRLGYGGGYYDRTLLLIRAANPGARFVGLAFTLQVVAALPREEHDIPLDGLVTEDGMAY